MKKKIGVVRFWGTNCDQDIIKAVHQMGYEPQWWWQADDKVDIDLADFAGVIIPGGFSFGDYLRAGAMAAAQPVMNQVKAAAKKQIPVLGICNGFQILCEAKLLPGVLIKNTSGVFVEKWVDLKSAVSEKSYRLPIAHGMGCFRMADEKALQFLEDSGQVWLRYFENPNGSSHDIAGIKSGSVMGLMPHPERAMFSWMGSEDGKKLLQEIFQ